MSWASWTLPVQVQAIRSTVSDHRSTSSSASGRVYVICSVQSTPLPERYRQAVYLRYYEGYEPAEIGTLMGCTASQVSTYLYRGKAKLRNMLGGAYGQECLSE